MKKTTDAYVVAPKTLLEANTAVNLEDGTEIVLFPETKLVYFYMRDQYVMHKGFGNREYIESWDRIFSTVCKVASQKQKQIVKQLTTLGLVEVQGRKNASKIVIDVPAIEGWMFTNPQLEEFLSDSNQEKRKVEKAQRMEDWKNKRKEEGTWEELVKEEEKLLRKKTHKLFTVTKTQPTTVKPTTVEVINESVSIKNTFSDEDLYSGEIPF